MTILYPDKFKKFKPIGFDGEFDWDFLIPAFIGTNIRPMDIDFIVERNGYFLIIETKSIDKDIPQGQQITFENLIKLGKGKIFVYILYGKTHLDIEVMEEWYYGKNNRVMIKPKIYCDSLYAFDRVSAWFNWANKCLK